LSVFTGPASSTGRLADGHADADAGVAHFLTAHQAFGRIHGDAAHGLLAEVLRDLDDEVFGLIVDRRVGDAQRIVDRRHIAAFEFHVDDRSDDLTDLSRAHDTSAKIATRPRRRDPSSARRRDHRRCFPLR
jgi:hypothetical protein